MRFTKFALVGMMALGAAVLSAQDIKLNLDQPAAPEAPAFTDEEAIESFGWFLAHQTGLVALGFSNDEIAILSRGMAKAVRGEAAPQDFEKIGPKIQSIIGARREAALSKMRDQGLAESLKFFEEVRAKEGVVSLPSGLAYEIVTEGTGPKPRKDQMVKVNYTGRLISGQVFDSSEGGEPAEFVLDGVIEGWSEGLTYVPQGSKVILYIPPHLAYGDTGSGEIPPGSTLIFEVELLEVKDAPKPEAEAAADPSK